MAKSSEWSAEPRRAFGLARRLAPWVAAASSRLFLPAPERADHMDFSKLDRAALRAKASGGKLKQYGVNGKSPSKDIVAALEQEAAAKAAVPPSSPRALLKHALGHATAAVAADT